MGLVVAGSLLLMPRLYGQAHLIDTDTPGLLLWAATALAFWNGLHEPNGTALAGRGRHLARPGLHRKDGGGHGALAALALADRRLSAPIVDSPGRRDSTGSTAVVTTGAMLVPLGLAFQQIQILQRQLPATGSHRPFRPSAGERLAGRDPGRSAG